MLKCFLLIPSFFCLVNSTIPELQISGTIIDKESGLPLQGVNICLNNDHNNTTSDARGNFMIRDLREGENSIQFSLEGYVPDIRTFNLNPGDSANLIINVLLIPVTLQFNDLIIIYQ